LSGRQKAGTGGSSKAAALDAAAGSMKIEELDES
jgi:hypothetical protein